MLLIQMGFKQNSLLLEVYPERQLHVDFLEEYTSITHTNLEKWILTKFSYNVQDLIVSYFKIHQQW